MNGWRSHAAALGLAVALAPGIASGQSWHETCGQTSAGVVAMRQAVLDAKRDALVLLVASHPDDRYVLPATWLRYCHGARIAVLLATRGGGGQNIIGPESGDALERIRTLETEAGCSHFDGEVWYLNRPDGGYRRTAEETYAEWGREETLRNLARLFRTIRPDAILTTHHRQESHGHDLALVDLLERAVPLAADPAFTAGGEPFRVPVFALGGVADSPCAVSIPVNRIEPVRGATLRRLAWNILRTAHRSPGHPAPMETVFEPFLRFEVQTPEPMTEFPFASLPNLFSEGVWPGTAAQRTELLRFVETELPAFAESGEAPERVVARLQELRALAGIAGISAGAHRRLQRRIEAVERVILLRSGAKIVLDVAPGTFAIEGEEFTVAAHLHVDRGVETTIRPAGVAGVDVTIGAEDAPVITLPHGGWRRVDLAVRVPLRGNNGVDPMGVLFRGDRFVPPVRLCFVMSLHGVQIEVPVTVPVEERAPVELAVVPRLLLLPASRTELQFSVPVKRNTRSPVESFLEVRAPAGYAIKEDRRKVLLRDQSSDLFSFEVRAAEVRRSGVDVLRISLAGARIVLPIHKVDVDVMPDLRVGVLRGRDDTLPNILGVGGLGLSWSELSDADIVAAELDSFDTIVVDIRALRDRPDARRGFRRLLDFAKRAGHRLIVFYHKDIEFDPEGKGFFGAPLQPFQIGKARVTRADAPIRVLQPEHVLLNKPNKIRPWDWDGWEQERALYLPNVYAAGFDELIEVNDPGKTPERGALLYTRTGEGEYVYCALALWRQLKKLHPGAVRLLANLLTPAGR